MSTTSLRRRSSSLNSKLIGHKYQICSSESSIRLRDTPSNLTNSREGSPHASVSDIFSNAYIPSVINYSNEFDDFFRETERTLLLSVDYVTEAYHLLTFVDNHLKRSSDKLRGTAFILAFAIDNIPLCELLSTSIQPNLSLLISEINSISNCTQSFFDQISHYEKLFHKCRKHPRSWRTRRRSSSSSSTSETEWKKKSQKKKFHSRKGLSSAFSSYCGFGLSLDETEKKRVPDLPSILSLGVGVSGGANFDIGIGVEESSQPVLKSQGWGTWKLYEKCDLDQDEMEFDDANGNFPIGENTVQDISSPSRSIVATQDILEKTRKLVALSHAMLLQAERKFFYDSQKMEGFTKKWISVHHTFKLADERSYYQWIIKITPLVKVLSFLINSIQEVIFMGKEILSLADSLVLSSISVNNQGDGENSAGKSGTSCTSSGLGLPLNCLPNKVARRLYKLGVQMGMKRTSLRSPELIRHEICKEFKKFVGKADVQAIPLITETHMYFLSTKQLYDPESNRRFKVVINMDDILEETTMAERRRTAATGDFTMFHDEGEGEEDENEDEYSINAEISEPEPEPEDPESCLSEWNRWNADNNGNDDEEEEAQAISIEDGADDAIADPINVDVDSQSYPEFSTITVVDQEGNIVDTFPQRNNDVDLGPGLIYVDTSDKPQPPPVGAGKSGPDADENSIINKINEPPEVRTASIFGNVSRPAARGGPAPSPRRHKLTPEEIAGINKTTGFGHHREHRKSSIPFANRAPRVRFMKSMERWSDKEDRRFEPVIIELSPPHFKSILKKSNFPIIIDMTVLDPTLRASPSAQSTNDRIIGCTNYVEQIIQLLSSADREARGCMDMLTFPVTSSTTIPMEPLARFQCALIIGILSIENFKILKPNFGDDMAEIVQLTESLTTELQKVRTQAKSFLKKVQMRYKQWEKLLNHKGEFKIRQRKTKLPIYPKKIMPENVSLYENELEDDPRFRSDGCIKIFREEADLVVTIECQGDIYTTYQKELNYNRTLHILHSVVEHAKQLVYHSNHRLVLAVNILNNTVFDTEFKDLKEKILNIEFDSFFDPLCALELKNALGDIVARKGDLLNIAEHVDNYVKWMLNFIKMFLRYCKRTARQYSKNKKGGGGGGGCAGCRPNVTAIMLMHEIKTYQYIDFMISIPLTDSFAKTFLGVDLTQSPSKVKLALEEYSM